MLPIPKMNKCTEHRWNDTVKETEVLVYKTCLSATFSTTNPNVQAWDWSWVSTMIVCQLTAWTMKQAVKMLIPVSVCSVIITCNLTHCMWLSHSADVCTRTESALTLYHAMCVKCTSSHISITHHPTYAPNIIQFMTSIKLLHVLALGCHPQGGFQNNVIQVQPANLGIASPFLKLLYY